MPDVSSETSAEGRRKGQEHHQENVRNDICEKNRDTGTEEETGRDKRERVMEDFLLDARSVRDDFT